MTRIIRGGPRPSPTSSPAKGARVIPGPVFEARAEAVRIVAAAQSEAAALVAASRAGAGRAALDAQEAGRLAGHAEVAVALSQALAIRDSALAEAEREVARVALAAAERLVGEALRVEPERIANIVGDALARARRARDVVVRVHPDDAAALESLRAVVAARAGRPGAFSVRPDPEVTRGGCLVETDLGTIDGRLETRLDALARALGV